MRRSSSWNRLAFLVLPASLALGLTLLLHAEPPKADPKIQPNPLSPSDAALPSDATRQGLIHRGAKDYCVWNIEFYDEEYAKDFAVEGSHVLGRHGKFLDVMFPLTKENLIEPEVFQSLKKVPGIYTCDWDTTVSAPEPTHVLADQREKPRGFEKIIRGGIGDLKGDGVLIAVLDTGIDFRHPDFIEEKDGRKTSRLLYFWDATRTHDPKGKGKAAPVTYPDGQPIGTIYSNDDLNEDLRAGNAPLGVTDGGGHGTACAGVAAGNGSSDKNFIGVAPHATLIGVRLQGERDSSYLLNEVVDWLDKIAKETKRPLVISCSWSQQSGGRDCTYVKERFLSERLPDTTPGRVLCFSAGNQGTSKIHARVKFEDEDTPALLEWKASQPTLLTICVDDLPLSQVSLKPKGNGKLPEFQTQKSRVSKTTFIHMRVPQGTGSLYLFAKDKPKTPYEADAYFPKYSADRPTFFTCPGVVNESQLGSPGTALAAITVASYDFNDQFHAFKEAKPRTIGTFDPTANDVKQEPLGQLGAISDYSNAGYLRQTQHLHGAKVIKPDLAAPGRCFTAPAAKGVEEQWLSVNPQYQYFDGTSAATPYTAGVVALLLQKKPTLTTAEFRKLLSDGGATKDDFTGALPNTKWGRGKLDYAAVERLLEKLK